MFHLLQLGGHRGQALPCGAQLAAQRGGGLAVLPRGRGLARVRALRRIRQPRLVHGDSYQVLLRESRGSIQIDWTY